VTTSNSIAVDAVLGEAQNEKKFRLSDRLFAALFNHLVYPQIWEDPEVDLKALELKDGEHVVAIASGGCNLLNMLTAADIRISALDLSKAHIALNRLKHAAIRGFETHEDFFNFFGHANRPENTAKYFQTIAPHLDTASRDYWERRAPFKRRIEAFNDNFYTKGVLGRFIGVSHFLARLLGVDPKDILRAENKEQQAEIFDATMGRLLKKPMVRKALQSPLSLYGLGIPAAQFQKLQGEAPAMAHVLHDRLRRLACDFDLSSNYFAWQAFGRCYDTARSVAIPRYLQQHHYQHLRDRVDNVAIYRKIATSFLKEQAVASVDGYVLLDAQDWMDDQQLNALWVEINRTATPKARVIFRTAGEENILLNRLTEENLSGWTYKQELSEALHLEDRSAIYGGFHLMVRSA
jgi:S-adenosylmethionine-diacylglycerol 3-amino-3-carboxypropyl transferase